MPARRQERLPKGSTCLRGDKNITKRFDMIARRQERLPRGSTCLRGDKKDYQEVRHACEETGKITKRFDMPVRRQEILPRGNLPAAS